MAVLDEKGTAERIKPLAGGLVGVVVHNKQTRTRGRGESQPDIAAEQLAVAVVLNQGLNEAIRRKGIVETKAAQVGVEASPVSIDSGVDVVQLSDEFGAGSKAHDEVIGSKIPIVELTETDGHVSEDSGGWIRSRRHFKLAKFVFIGRDNHARMDLKGKPQ